MVKLKDLIVGAIVMAILIFGCILENRRDQAHGDHEGPLMRTWLAVLLAVAIFAFAIVGAHFVP